MKKRSESEWRSLFSAHAESDLTAAAFCRERGLCPKYFSLRKRQLGVISGKRTPFIAVQKSQAERAHKRCAVPSLTPQPETGGDIRLRYQGMEILIPMTSPRLAVEIIRGLL